MSALSQTSISRPVLAGVMSVLLILFGIVGYTFLGTREYPVTDSPIVTVTTVYPGASADIIASQVTKPLEEAIAEANGIRATAIHPGEINTPLIDRRAIVPPPEARAKMLQPADLAGCVAFVATLPPRVVIESLLVTPLGAPLA